MSSSCLHGSHCGSTVNVHKHRFSLTVSLNIQRLSGRCPHLYHSTTPLSKSTPLSLWCTWVEAAHPGLFRLFSIYSNITDNDPTYKTISTPARRMAWIKAALRPIFTPIMYLWQVEREADRYSRRRYQFQQVLAEILATLSTISNCCGRKRAASQLSTLAAFSTATVFAREVISVLQQQEKNNKPHAQKRITQCNKVAVGGNASGTASVSQFWEIKFSFVVGPDASSRCNL